MHKQYLAVAQKMRNFGSNSATFPGIMPPDA